MKKYNYIVSVVMIALAGYIFYEASTYDIGTSAQKNPAVWPMFLAGALALLSVVLIIQTIFSRDPEMKKDIIDWKGPGMRKVYIMVGFVVAFVVLMKIFGMLILPVGLIAFVYLFFVVIMKITLPAPIWA